MITQAIIAAILLIIKEHSTIICSRVQAKWGNQSIQGEAHIESNVTFAGSMILSSIFAGGMKAFICEEGSGSLLNRDNPDLAEYVGSELFNPYRGNDFKIRGRGMGDYRDLDGNTQTSSGLKQGIVIESSKYKAYLTQHLIQFEIDSEIDEIEMRILETAGNILMDYTMLKFPKSMTL